MRVIPSRLLSAQTSAAPMTAPGTELTRNERQETTFRCSDELLNQFWEIGKQTLRRSAAFVPLAESRADNDCYMLDAYIDWSGADDAD